MTYCAIIPNRNDGESFPKAFDGIINQSRPFDEIIVVDDASTDNSRNVIEACIRGHPSARLIQNRERLNVTGAVNRGIKECRSDFMLPCSANDEYKRNLVQDCDTLLRKYPQVGIVSGQLENHPLRFKSDYYTPEALLEHHRNEWPRTVYFPGGACMLRTGLVRHFGCFQPKLEWHSDLILYHLIALRTGVAISGEVFLPKMKHEPTGNRYSDCKNCWEHQRKVIRAIIDYVENFDEGVAFKSTKNMPCFFVSRSTLLKFIVDGQLRRELYQRGYCEGRLPKFIIRCLRRLIPY